MAGVAGGAAALAAVSLVAALFPEHTPRSESEIKVGLQALGFLRVSGQYRFSVELSRGKARQVVYHTRV